MVLVNSFKKVNRMERCYVFTVHCPPHFVSDHAFLLHETHMKYQCFTHSHSVQFHNLQKVQKKVLPA